MSPDALSSYVDSTISKKTNIANPDLIKAHHGSERTSGKERDRAGREPVWTQGLSCPHARGRVPVPLAELQPPPHPALPVGAGGMEINEADGSPLLMNYLRFLSVQG